MGRIGVRGDSGSGSLMETRLLCPFALLDDGVLMADEVGVRGGAPDGAISTSPLVT